MLMRPPNVSHNISHLSHDYISFLRPSVVTGEGTLVREIYNQASKMNYNEDFLIFCLLLHRLPIPQMQNLILRM